MEMLSNRFLAIQMMHHHPCQFRTRHIDSSTSICDRICAPPFASFLASACSAGPSRTTVFPSGEGDAPITISSSIDLPPLDCAGELYA